MRRTTTSRAWRASHPHADYVTVNISSPNTQNLRALQSDAAGDALLAQLQTRRLQLAQQHGRKVPLFVKIVPALDAAHGATIQLHPLK